MKFMLQMIADASPPGNAAPGGATAFRDRVSAFNRELNEAGAWVTAEDLQDPAAAVTLRFEEGAEPVVSHGPFADRDEQLVGFWIVEAPTIDEAVALARTVPLTSGAVEVRPLAFDPVD
jgi:hypothetical protein